MDPATHRALLDAFAEHTVGPDALAAFWREWREARSAPPRRRASWPKAAPRRICCGTITPRSRRCRPRRDEEERLGARRALLQNAERLGEAIGEAIGEIEGEAGAQRALARALRRLERARDRAQGLLDGAVAAAERAAQETDEALAALTAAGRASNSTRARSKKSRNGCSRCARWPASIRWRSPICRSCAPRWRSGWPRSKPAPRASPRSKRKRRRRAPAIIAAAEAVSAARERAASRLDAAVAAELAPLRLDKARFRTVLTPLAEADWGEHGTERVHFEVATNPGAPFGTLAKIASGGELSRFMLALKLVLAGTSSVPTLIFDEVDSGIGGAVAAAVGERLQRLGARLQVLVVTHSPQVAARGAHHWRIAKTQAARATVTRVEELDPDTKAGGNRPHAVRQHRHRRGARRRRQPDRRGAAVNDMPVNDLPMSRRGRSRR